MYMVSLPPAGGRCYVAGMVCVLLPVPAEKLGASKRVDLSPVQRSRRASAVLRVFRVEMYS